MTKLTRDDLWSLEEYAEKRPEFLAKVMQHKKTRQIALSDNARLYFENELTIRYQIQEMLKIEKIFEAKGIEDELDTYNPLIPDGSNWKATFMLEYIDPEIRKQKLTQLKGIEKTVWVQVDNYDKVFPIANEDLQRETEEKTSAVHFLRFELTAPMVAEVKHGAEISMGIDHPNHTVGGRVIEKAYRDSLAEDLAEPLVI